MHEFTVKIGWRVSQIPDLSVDIATRIFESAPSSERYSPVMDDECHLRRRRDALVKSERRTADDLCRIRDELDAIAGRLDRLNVTRPAMMAGSATGLPRGVIDLLSLRRRRNRP